MQKEEKTSTIKTKKNKSNVITNVKESKCYSKKKKNRVNIWDYQCKTTSQKIPKKKQHIIGMEKKSLWQEQNTRMCLRMHGLRLDTQYSIFFHQTSHLKHRIRFKTEKEEVI